MKGVSKYPLRHIMVSKGDIYHALKATDDGFRGFGEAYFTRILHGEVKGWKRHNKITLNLVVALGCVKFVVYDDREGSPSKGEFCELILSPDDDYCRFTLDPGLWMAFTSVSEGESIVLDIINMPHDLSETDSKTLDEIPYKFDV
jgi:dTDP-4-dehydrorhamnose 3,5-epimerase